MTTNDANSVRNDDMHIVGMSHIFHVIGDSQAEDVIGAALQHRAHAGASARDALNAALDSSGIAIPGFRKQSRAQSGALVGPVLLEAINGNDRLASAVLRVWAEAREDLTLAATEYLDEKGVPVLDLKRDYFHALWPKNICLLEGNIIAASHKGLDGQDVALMLCCLSGSFPEGAAYDSDLFTEWTERLGSLPPEAPEWDEAAVFVADVLEISVAKIDERNAALRETFGTAIADVVGLFEGDLAYLGISPGAWGADIAARPDLISEARPIVALLRSALEAYHDMRPQAATRTEELQRARERSEREAEILAIVDSWGELMSTPKDPDERTAQSPVGPDAVVPVEDYQRLEAEKAELTVENARLTQAHDAVRQANDKLHTEKEYLTAENARLTQAHGSLQQSYDKLRMEKEEQSAREQQPEARAARKQAT